MPIGTIPEELFVGRAEELEHLEEALRLTAEKHGRMEMLVGEPGIGKTRLAEKLCERARARGVRVLAGRCVEDAGTPPYWLWVQAAEPYLESLKPKQLSATLGGSAPLLAMVFPVVNRLLPGLRPFGVVTEKPEELRFRLLDAVASLLVRISNETPLLIALDDLHWADEGTLGLLVAVARERLYERHALEGLSEAEVREYCAAALPPGGSAEVPRAVHAVTEGNPLFVVEVVRDLVHQGVGSLDGGLPHLPEGRGK